MTGRVQCVVLDCPDPIELARFYQALLGGTVNLPDARWAADADFSTLHTPDLDQAHAQALELGATLLQADPRGWRVFADPAGHPFRLLQAR